MSIQYLHAAHCTSTPDREFNRRNGGRQNHERLGRVPQGSGCVHPSCLRAGGGQLHPKPCCRLLFWPSTSFSPTCRALLPFFRRAQAGG